MYNVFWNLKASSTNKAMFMISQTTNNNEFWQAGQEIAQSFSYYVIADAIVLDFGCGIGRVAKFLAPHVREL